MSHTDSIDCTPTVKQNITLYPTKDTPKEILWALAINHPGVADYTPQMIVEFIPSGACPQQWLKAIGNIGTAKPKRKRTSRHQTSKRLNHAAAVVGRDRALGVAL